MTEETKKSKIGPSNCVSCGMGVLGDLPESGLCPLCEINPEASFSLLSLFKNGVTPENFAEMLSTEEEPPSIPEEAKTDKLRDQIRHPIYGKSLSADENSETEDRACLGCSHYNTCLMRIRLSKAFDGELHITKHSTRVKVYRAIGTDCSHFAWNDELLLNLEL